MAALYRTDGPRALPSRRRDIIFNAIASYIGKLQENEDIFAEIEKNQNMQKRQKEKELKKETQVLDKINQKISVIRNNIPEAMTGNYPLSVDELVALMREQEEESKKQIEIIKMKEQELKDTNVSIKDWEDIRGKIDRKSVV